jgi:hypothetical protein
MTPQILRARAATDRLVMALLRESYPTRHP